MDEQLITKINQIWQAAKIDSPLNQKSAVSISTIDAAGFPQSRFVDLKDVGQSGFTFCTSYESQKGKQLLANPKVSLLAWWDHIGYQIRVVGTATRISEELADKFWATRSKDAQVATTCFNQSEIWPSEASIIDHFSSALSVAEESISRPSSWGGFSVVPHSVEILKFKASRVHSRELYQQKGQSWKRVVLQP